MAGFLGGFFGAGSGPIPIAAPAGPAVANPAGTVDLVGALTVGQWNQDIAVVTRSVQADLRAVASATNTSQDMPDIPPRSGAYIEILDDDGDDVDYDNAGLPRCGG